MNGMKTINGKLVTLCISVRLNKKNCKQNATKNFACFNTKEI